MEKVKILIIFIALLFSELVPQGVYSQWVFLNPQEMIMLLLNILTTLQVISSSLEIHFYKVTSSLFNLEPKLRLKGYYLSSVLSGDGFAVVSCDSGSIYVTTDAGESWNIFDIPEPLICKVLSRGTDNRIYAGMNDGTIYISDDNGSSFTFLSTLPKKEISSLCVSSKGTFLAGFKGVNRGIYRSTNNGQSWTFVNNAVHITEIKSFALSDTLYSFFVSDTISSPVRLMKSTDDGLTLDTFQSLGGIIQGNTTF
ncbi:MAG: hypothetical protein IPG53_17195 [Ignavibacteriales bacterium]|nr:hypothetical protein [Ignavibacteriales bacterium]